MDISQSGLSYNSNIQSHSNFTLLFLVNQNQLNESERRKGEREFFGRWRGWRNNNLSRFFGMPYFCQHSFLRDGRVSIRNITFQLLSPYSFSPSFYVVVSVYFNFLSHPPPSHPATSETRLAYSILLTSTPTLKIHVYYFLLLVSPSFT